jgi:spermidine synthase
MTPPSKTISARTRFASISIVQNTDTVELRVDSNALHSVINLKHPEQLELKNLEYLMGVLLFIATPKNVLLLGTGGGSMVHFLRHHYPSAQLTCVDYDAELQELMHREMQLPAADENLDYLIEDASSYLLQSNQQFDLILVDLFSGSQSPDWLLETPEISRIYNHLSPQGAVAYNLIVDSKHDFNRFIDSVDRVFKQKFLSLPVEGFENRIVYGFHHVPSPQDMSFYIERAALLTNQLDIDYQSILAAIYTSNPVGSAVIY